MRPQLFPVLLAACLSGCAHPKIYRPIQLDPQTGLYPTTTQVRPGALLNRKTTVSPATFGVVLLRAKSNYMPANFEYAMRQAFAQMNRPLVMNQAEFDRFAADHNIDAARLGDAPVREVSSKVAPVMVVDALFSLESSAYWAGGVRISDGRTGEPLLFVNHTKTVWSDQVNEVLYPMLNELRHWFADSSQQRT